MKWGIGLLVLGVLVLAACQPPQPTDHGPLPTLMDLNGIASSETATSVAQVPPTRTPLPPTWTPSPPPSPIPSEMPPTATPVYLGTIFYIFNGDSVVALKADGSSEQLILVSGAPTELTLSPDNQLLAYVAQGAGSAREVFVSSLDGTYTQQVSCLGFARVLSPTWHPDSQSITFAASQTPDGPLGLYGANVIGSGQCPTGNQQRQLVQLESNRISNLTWNPSAEWIYFSDGAIYGWSVITGTLTNRLTSPTGFGPDFSPAHSPVSDQLFYLKTAYNEKTSSKGGTLYQIKTASPESGEMRGAAYFAQRIRWSDSGAYLLIATDRDIWVQEQRTNSSVQVMQGSNFYPQPVFSPDATNIAFVDGGRGNLAVQQIFVIERDGGARKQLTTHGEGTISDLVWSSS